MFQIFVYMVSARLQREQKRIVCYVGCRLTDCSVEEQQLVWATAT